ncbi:MAG: hypothetical protein WC350_04500 [Candidatus Micrarchaeia archaeon]|jgi:hypothetical protein
MGEPVVAKPVPGITRDAPKARRPAKLTFGQRFLLLAGIAAIGGAPSYICIRGVAPEQRNVASPTAVVTNAPETSSRQLRGACTVKEEPKSQMAIQGKGRNE